LAPCLPYAVGDYTPVPWILFDLGGAWAGPGQLLMLLPYVVAPEDGEQALNGQVPLVVIPSKRGGRRYEGCACVRSLVELLPSLNFFFLWLSIISDASMIT